MRILLKVEMDVSDTEKNAEHPTRAAMTMSIIHLELSKKTNLSYFFFCKKENTRVWRKQKENDGYPQAYIFFAKERYTYA